MKKTILIICAGILALILIAATFISISDGDWSDTPTWGVTAPSTSTSDNITIATNVQTTANVTIKTGGYLTILSGCTLTVNDMQFNNGCFIIIENGAFLIINGNLVNKTNSQNIEVNGSILVVGNFDNGNSGVLFGDGEITVNGSFTGTGVTFGYTNEDIPPGSTVSSGSLPIELLYFVLKQSGQNTVLLKWATVSETNNDYFTLDRSGDNFIFTTLSNIQGFGNSNETKYYSFTDQEPLPGVSYYRLLQTDYDGSSEIVGVIANNNNTKNNTPYLLIYDLSGHLIYKGNNIPYDDISSGIYIVRHQYGSYKIYME